MVRTLLRRAASLGSSANYYISLDARVVASTTAHVNDVVMATDGTARNLDITLSVDPGGAATRIFTLMINGVATALTVTITAGGALHVSDTANDVAYVAGNRLRLQATRTATPVTTDVHWSMDLDSTDTVSSSYGTNIDIAVSGFVDPLTGEKSATASDCQRLIPYPGMITAIFATTCIATPAVPTGDALDFYLFLNGVKQDGTGGTVNTKTTLAAGAAGTVFFSTFSLVVVRGDYIYLSVTDVSAPSPPFVTQYVAVSIRYEAEVAGVSIIACRGDNDPNSGSAYYHALTQNGTLWAATDIAAQRLYCGVTSIGLSYLILDVTVDPGAAPNTRTYEVMKNGAVPGGAPAGVISTGVLRIDDTSGAVSYVSTDVIGPMRHTPASTPTVTGEEYWSLVMYDVGAGSPPPPPPPPTGGGGGGTGIDPAVSNLGTGVKRVFMQLTLGQGSPYTEMAFAETMLRDNPAWFGGKKLPRLLDVSPIVRELAPAIRGVEVRVVLADDQNKTFRTLATTDTVSGAIAEIFVVEDTVRYAEQEPYRLFTGKVYSHRALPGFQYELTIRDALSEEIAIVDDAPRMPPGTLTTTKFPGLLAEYEGRAIPLVLGQCSDDTSDPGALVIAPQGVIPPVILAQINFATAFGGINQDVIAAIWSQCALAANGVWQVYYNTPDNPYVRVQVPLSAFGTILWTPGMPGWSSTGLATDSVDYPVPPDPEARRYTPLFIAANHVYAQAVLDGKILIAGNLYGVAENADGSGRYLDDAPIIWQWLLCNYLFTEYRTGSYAGIPDFAGIYSIINTGSVATTTARLHGFLGLSPSVYPVGFLLGRDGSQQTLRHVLDELCAGVAMETGIDRHGRLMLDVEDVAAVATVTLSDIFDIEDGSFEVWIDREGYFNRIEFVYGRRYLPPSAPVATPAAGDALPAEPVQPYSEWTFGLQSVEHAGAIAANHGRARVHFIENYVVRSSAVIDDVVARLLARAVGPSPSYDGPRLFRLTTSWQGLMKNGIEVELGTVIAIDHLEGFGAAGYVGQKARVLKITVDPLNARITLEGRVLFP